MYPHVIQFETRSQGVAGQVRLARERRATARVGRARRRWPRIALRGGATAAFA
jgi:hypothetical protein